MLLFRSVFKSTPQTPDMADQPSQAGLWWQRSWSQFSNIVTQAHRKGWLPRRFTPSLVAGAMLAVVLAVGLAAAVQLGSQSADLRQQAYVVSDPGSGNAPTCSSLGGKCKNSQDCVGNGDVVKTEAAVSCPGKVCCVASSANISCPSGSTCNLNKTTCGENYVKTGSCKQGVTSGVCCFANLVAPSPVPDTPNAQQVIECWDKNNQCNRLLVFPHECLSNSGRYRDRQSCIGNLDRAKIGWSQTCQADQGCVCPDNRTKVDRAKKCPTDPKATKCPAGYFDLHRETNTNDRCGENQTVDVVPMYVDDSGIPVSLCYTCVPRLSTNCFDSRKGCSIKTIYSNDTALDANAEAPKCDGKTLFSTRQACESGMYGNQKICWSFDATKGFCVSSTQYNNSNKPNCSAIDPKYYDSAGECTTGKDKDYITCYDKKESCTPKIYPKNEYATCQLADIKENSQSFTDYNECRGRADEFVCFDAQDNCAPKSFNDSFRDCNSLNSIRSNPRYHVGLTDCKQQLPKLNIPAGNTCPSYQDCVCNGGPDAGKTIKKGIKCAEQPAVEQPESTSTTPASTSGSAGSGSTSTGSTAATTPVATPAVSSNFACRLYVSGLSVGPGSVDCRKNPSNGQFIWQKCAPPHTGEGEIYEGAVGLWSPCQGANGSLPSAESLLRLAGLSTGPSCPPASQCTGEVDLRGTDLVKPAKSGSDPDEPAMSVNCSAIKSFNACLATGVCEFAGDGCVSAEVPLDAPHLAGCDDQHVCQEAEGCACRAICNKANTVIKKGETCGGYDPKYLTPPEQIKNLSSCSQACLSTSGCGCPGDQCQLSIAEYGYTCNGDTIPVEEMLQAYGEAVGAPLLETCSQECNDVACRCQPYCLLSAVDKNQSCGGLDPTYGANVCGVIKEKTTCNSDEYPYCEWRRNPGFLAVFNPSNTPSCKTRLSIDKDEVDAADKSDVEVDRPSSGSGGSAETSGADEGGVLAGLSGIVRSADSLLTAILKIQSWFTSSVLPGQDCNGNDHTFSTVLNVENSIRCKNDVTISKCSEGYTAYDDLEQITCVADKPNLPDCRGGSYRSTMGSFSSQQYVETCVDTFALETFDNILYRNGYHCIGEEEVSDGVITCLPPNECSDDKVLVQYQIKGTHLACEDKVAVLDKVCSDGMELKNISDFDGFNYIMSCFVNDEGRYSEKLYCFSGTQYDASQRECTKPLFVSCSMSFHQFDNEVRNSIACSDNQSSWVCNSESKYSVLLTGEIACLTTEEVELLGGFCDDERGANSKENFPSSIHQSLVPCFVDMGTSYIQMFQCPIGFSFSNESCDQIN